MRFRLILFTLVAMLASFPLAGAAAPKPAASATDPLAVGLNCGRDTRFDAHHCKFAGAKIARVEVSIDTPATHMDKLIRTFVTHGIKIQPLAGFHGRLPTVEEARNLRSWAVRFGPKGTFWRKKDDRRLAVTNIELGNETSYGWQYGDGTADESYRQRARDYALRARDAALALRGTGVRVLVQGDDGGSRNTTWLDEVFGTVPDLARRVGGWTIHPYGPEGQARIEQMLGYLRAKGATRARAFITEWGLASDDGRALSDNYGYRSDMTYEHAALTMRATLQGWKRAFGPALAQVLIYRSTDGARTGTTTDREGYFGVLRTDGSAKGAYAQQFRALAAAR